MPNKRKICFIITSKIHYGRSKLILKELKNRDDVELQIVIGASAILRNYGDVVAMLEKDGFICNARITMTLEGGNAVAMAKTTGIGISEFTTVFDNLKPDIVMVRGDRYEVMAAVIAAAYLNITVAHIEGGDLSGTIDESVRHAITKLSHIHFSTNDDSFKRILRMGEDPRYVFNFGCPELEFAAKNTYVITNEFINSIGAGDTIDINKPFLMVMQHPVTTEVGRNRKNIEETLRAVMDSGRPTLWFWPNVDAGTDEISKGIRVFRERYQPQNMRFVRSVPPEEFIGLLKLTACLVGNSSAGLKECSLLGTPAVNIGTRQHKRLRAHNVLDVGYNSEEIRRGIERQLENGRHEPSSIYYKEGTTQKISEILATIDLYSQKSFHE